MSAQQYVWEGRRVTLRAIEEKDAPDIVKWRNDPAVYLFFKTPKEITVQEHLEWYRTAYLNNENRIDFIVETREDKGVGTAGIEWDPQEGQAEVSYLIGREYRRRGVAGEALETLCAHAALVWPVKAFQATIHEDNVPSQKFITAQGFKRYNREGRFITFVKEVPDL